MEPQSSAMEGCCFWLAPHGFLSLLSYSTYRGAPVPQEVALPKVDWALPHQENGPHRLAYG